MLLFKCMPVDLYFFDNAPYLFEYQVKIPAPAEKVFNVLEDWETWPKWYKNIRKIQPTGDKKNGLGSTRITTMTSGIAADETFFIWEPNQKIAFYTTRVNLPSVRALAEIYELVPIDDNTCFFNYTVGVDPIFPFGLTGNLGKKIVEQVFKDAPQSLANYMQQQ